MCNQQSLRSACAYAQSDQSFCLSLNFLSVKLLTELHFVFLGLKGGCTGSSESTLVKMPQRWKSRHNSFEMYDWVFSFRNRILHECSCFIEFINGVEEKR